MGLDERYHVHFRNRFRKLTTEHLEIDKHLTVVCPVKAINDSLYPEGLVFSNFVFKEYPNIKISTNSKRRTLHEREEFAELRRIELETYRASFRIRQALKHRQPRRAPEGTI